MREGVVIVAELEVGSVEYLSAAETAKLVRGALKREYGRRCKFSVRSSVYSMGASVHVRWTDGPTQRGVERIVSGFAGGGFDGMIDLAYSVDSWLMPDGTATLAYSPGTEGSMGVYPGAIVDPPAPDARLVSFLADYVFAERELSEDMRGELEALVLERWGGAERMAEQTGERLDRLTWRESCRWDRFDGVLVPAPPEACGDVAAIWAWVEDPSQSPDAGRGRAS